MVTTKTDRAAARPPDLVDRDFTATRPNQLWVVDFSYVVTWSGMAFTAFVSEVFSRRIVGWRTAAAMLTELPLDALEMARTPRAGNPELGALVQPPHRLHSSISNAPLIEYYHHDQPAQQLLQPTEALRQPPAASQRSD